MNVSNYFKIIEIIILGFFFPISIVFFNFSEFILVFLWLVSLYCIAIILIFYKNKIFFTKQFALNLSINKKYIIFIIFRWIILSLLLFLFTFYLFPEKLFLIQKNNSELLYKIFILYPIFSAFPQEFIFCSFFFIRYKSLFSTEKQLVFTSAIVFCFAHIFSINWVAPFLSFFGGFMFANTYKKTKSLTIVSMEHAFYGNSLFAIGLGWFFWGGAVS